MTPMFRLTKTFLQGIAKDKLSFSHISAINMRVWPNDLDVNLHMNNGRFLTLMDFGRFDFFIRTALGRICLKNKWRPLVGSAKIQFRKPLRVFTLFQLKTSVSSWDSKWLYMDQNIETQKSISASAKINLLFVGPDGKVPTQNIFHEIGFAGKSHTTQIESDG